MRQERLGPTNLTLEQLVEASPETELAPVSIEGRNPISGYSYGFGFISEHPSNGTYISIYTEHRRDFLARGTEQQAQDALVALAQQTRQRCGGSFDVHGFYGAVWDTKLTPVSPGFCTNLKGLGENLTMFVNLAHKANPNQGNRNQAIANGLGSRWDKEFRKYHQGVNVPPAMVLTPRNIVGLMKGLESDAAITNLEVTRVGRLK